MTVKLRVLVPPPPGEGLTTPTTATAAAAISAAVMAAVKRMSLTKVVERLLPFQYTVDCEMKPVPFTVREKAGPPAAAEDGDNETMVGTGFPAMMVKVAGLEVPPPGPGLVTVMSADPAKATSLAEMSAVSVPLFP
jgi:hypothetical protein